MAQAVTVVHPPRERCPNHASVWFVLICPECSRTLWEHMERLNQMDAARG